MSTTEAEMSRDELLEELQCRKKQLHLVDGERLRLYYAVRDLHREVWELKGASEDLRDRINELGYKMYDVTNPKVEP